MLWVAGFGTNAIAGMKYQCDIVVLEDAEPKVMI